MGRTTLRAAAEAECSTRMKAWTILACSQLTRVHRIPLTRLGRDIRTARLRRNWRLEDLAARWGAAASR